MTERERQTPRRHEGSALAQAYRWRPSRQEEPSFWRRLSPPQLFVGSFLLLIALGTVGFMALPGLYVDEPLTWTDAFFTATSAVCVTGLIVVDTATYFTPFGQAYILLLIQLGGLGIISFTTIIIVVLGRRLSLRHERLATEGAHLVPEVDYRQLVRDVFLFTFSAEAVGAVLLYLGFGPQLGWEWSESGWHAVFQAISAFCNAGFSTFSDSLMGFQLVPGLLITVMVLIVLGGIGFLTLEELYLWQKKQRSQERFSLSLHSRIVLVTTAVLLIGGWLVLTFFEWGRELEGMPLWGRLLNGLFASVTARTAGFNTIDYAETAGSTNFFTILLMVVGGSPGSMAGGLKTTTAALLGLLAWARLRGFDSAHVWSRTVPEGTLHRAVGLSVIGFVIITAGVFLYTITELPGAVAPTAEGTFFAYMFEAVSAFNTVGLSMGPTGDLSTPGRWFTIALMFAGRVGPLSIAAALAHPKQRLGAFRYAHEDVAIG